MDHRQTPQGVPLQNQRRFTNPAKYAEELQWFAGFNRPEGLLYSPQLDNLEEFKKLIWDNPSNTMIPQFNCYVDEMADLCCNGWVSTSHILWMAQRVNEAQNDCLCLCLPGDTPEMIAQRIRRRGLEDIRKIVCIINVGKLPDNSVFFGTDLLPGSHWVMATVDLAGPTVLYCDSNAWDCPPDILPVLSDFTSLFGVPVLPPDSLQLAHAPTPAGFHHKCSPNCIRYPLQSCSDICGILCMVMMVSVATDPDFFSKLLQSQTQIYMHDPSCFSGFLRRTVISWFFSGTPDTTFLRPVPETPADHAYARKRRDTRCGPSLSTKSKRQRTHPPSTAGAPPRPSTNNPPGSAHPPQPGTSAGPRTTAAHPPQPGTSAGPRTTAAHPPQPGTSSGPWTTAAHPPQPGTSAGPRTTAAHPPQPGTSADPRPTSSSAGQKQPKEYVCSVCNKRLASRQSLFTHRRTIHAGQPMQTNKRPGYQCVTCDMSATCVRDLIYHYSNVHQRDHRILQDTFSSEEDFFDWKKEIEQSSFSQFVKTCGDQKSKAIKISYYYCHRSGVQQRKVTERKRSMKLQGSCKSSNKCISYVIARKDILTGTVDVEYCLDHIGHKIQLCHLKISDELRNTIAAKLAQGLEVGNILTEMRDQFREINRDTLLTRQDIHNIAKQFNISSTQRHANDKISVDLWVSELSRDVDNPVIFYKSQGNEHEVLKDEDILLCLQTKFQKEMLLKYHSKIICADSTHKTTQYDFQLTSVLVLDDHEEAIPVAWAISNREDADVLKIFLGAVREACGQDLQTETFMSDLASNFFNAWCDVFSKPDKRLYCSWHTDKSWRRQVNSLVTGKQTQSLVYAYLKLIQSETKEATFRKMLQEFFSFLSEEAPKFLDYFSKHYVYDNKTALWASCYRLGTIANTNMFAEAFHRTLKTVYFNKKQNRRVDNLLFVLLKLARDKAVEQLIKSEKGKITHRIREIRKRHETAKSVQPKDIINVSKDEWTIKSSSVASVTYSLKKVSSHDVCNCKLICDACNACVHMYTCTCSDYLVRTVMCKHIHAVHMNTSTSKETPDSNNSCQNEPEDFDCHSDTETSERMAFYKTILCNDQPENSGDVEKVKSSALSKASDIIQLIKDSNDISLVQAACTRLTGTLSILRGMNTLTDTGTGTQKDFDKTESFPGNKNFDPQPRFTSTRSKSISTGRNRLKLRKPPVQENQQLHESLSCNEAKVCSLCYKEDDPSSYNSSALDDSDVLWRNCDVCMAWVHTTCDCIPIPTKVGEEYICPVCRVPGKV